MPGSHVERLPQPSSSLSIEAETSSVQSPLSSRQQASATEKDGSLRYGSIKSTNEINHTNSASAPSTAKSGVRPRNLFSSSSASSLSSRKSNGKEKRPNSDSSGSADSGNETGGYYTPQTSSPFQGSIQDNGSIQKVEIVLNTPIHASPPVQTRASADTEEDTHDEHADKGEEEQEGVLKKGGKFAKGMVTFSKAILPKAEPLPWKTFYVLTFFLALPSVSYVLLFTKMGFGFTTMYHLSTNFEQYSSVIFGLLIIVFFTLYLFDAEAWTSPAGRISRNIGVAFIFILVFLLVLFLTGEYPYGPICLFSVLTPVWMVGVKSVIYRDVNPKTYVSWLTGPLICVSMIVGITWMAWTFAHEENEWNAISRISDVEAVGCEPDFEEYPECQAGSDGEVCFVVDANTISFPEGCGQYCVSVYDACLNTFILWVGPLLVSIALFFLSFFCSFLRSDSEEKELINFAKLWLFLLFAMWVGASLAGAGSGIMISLMALTLAAFVGSGVLLSISFSNLAETAKGSTALKGLSEKYGGHMDVARGLLIVTCMPVFLMYLALSFVNQVVRRAGCFPCSVRVVGTGEFGNGGSGSNRDGSTSVSDSDGDGNQSNCSRYLTKRASRQVREFKKWDRSKIYTYAVYWGIAFITVQVVVAQFTLVFMSWLIEKTQAMPLTTVTLVMVGVGLIMFLLPPVPGVPIYLTLGIVTVARGRESLGIMGSMIYSAIVSLVLKLLACALQQKLIGESMSKYVSIRQMVAVNSSVIRSMKLVLSKPGLSVPKVAILIGGPDWPTSVLCGIMRLGLFQILLGTVPIILLILPTMLTGSFVYLASLKVDGVPEFPWAGTVGTICATLTAIVQLGSMLVAAYYLEQTVSTCGEEMENMPFDEEVRAADAKGAQEREVYSDVTKWEVVPTWAKGILMSSVATMVTSCYMVQLFPHLCFVDYELTYSVQEHLDGNVANLILPLGWVALFIFVVSCCLLKIFTTWATRKSRRIMKACGFSLLSEKADQEENTQASMPSPTATMNTTINSSIP